MTRLRLAAGACAVLAMLLGPARATRADDPGLVLTLSPVATLVDGVYVELQATATCDPSYASTIYQGGMYLNIGQSTHLGDAGGEGDAGESTGPGLDCDGRPHTYTTQAFTDIFSAPFKAGPAEYFGTLYLWTTSGDLFYTQTRIQVELRGAPPPPPVLPNALGFTLGPAIANGDGSVDLTVQGACGSEYDGDYISVDAEIQQRTSDALVDGYGGGYAPLQCDGEIHRYILGPVAPFGPDAGYRPGLAVIPFSETMVSTPDGQVVDDSYGRTSGLHIVG